MTITVKIADHTVDYELDALDETIIKERLLPSLRKLPQYKDMKDADIFIRHLVILLDADVRRNMRVIGK